MVDIWTPQTCQKAYCCLPALWWGMAAFELKRRQSVEHGRLGSHLSRCGTQFVLILAVSKPLATCAIPYTPRQRQFLLIKAAFCKIPSHQIPHCGLLSVGYTPDVRYIGR